MSFRLNNFVFKFLVLLALIIVGVTLWYTHNLAAKFQIEEEKKVALWAKATQILSNPDTNDNLNLLLEVVASNTTIPVILADQNNHPIAHRNIITDNKNSNRKKEIDIKEQIELIKTKYPDHYIEIELIDGTKNYIYYKDSKLLQNLKYFPLFMLSIIGAFIVLVYFAFSNARIAQQNKVWTGMAKETAHQIGTPLSSLIGWVEYLKEKKESQSITDEVQKDINRLQKIANRFSKIGSLPKLKKIDIIPILNGSIEYMCERASSKVTLELSTTENKVETKINSDLFEWVIENLIKNSIDAISKEGKVTLHLEQNSTHIFLDVIDNGKGVKKGFFNEIFEPGFTSKKRGWGLGLSLVKRIIQDYHLGKVGVLRSIPNKQTVIRIVLNR